MRNGINMGKQTKKEKFKIVFSFPLVSSLSQAYVLDASQIPFHVHLGNSLFHGSYCFQTKQLKIADPALLTLLKFQDILNEADCRQAYVEQRSRWLSSCLKIKILFLCLNIIFLVLYAALSAPASHSPVLFFCSWILFSGITVKLLQRMPLLFHIIHPE
jgi:hypothetical protein